MERFQSPGLEMPTFLYGAWPALQRLTQEEGQRCAAQYRQEGSLPLPQESRPVPPGEVLIVHDVVDFLRARPAWRLYMLGDVVDSLCQAFNYKDSSLLRAEYEALALETAWGALYHATGRAGPYDAGCYSHRFKAVLRFWEVLDSVRYLFSSPSAALTLEELMMAACDWAPRAWCPEGGGSFRARLGVAAERMARATQEACIEAILRQLPHILPLARKLKHPRVFADPGYWRERLPTLDPEIFQRMSAALPSEVLLWAHVWDKQLGMQ